MRSVEYWGSYGHLVVIILGAMVWLPHKGCADHGNIMGYSCSDSKRTLCHTFVLYRSQTKYSTVKDIADLFNVDASSVAKLNNLQAGNSVALKAGVFVPIDCRCDSNFVSYACILYIVEPGDTFFNISANNFESLSTVQAILSANSLQNPENLQIGQTVLIPIHCACPNSAQLYQGVRALVTYPVADRDTLPAIASRFGVPPAEIQRTNTLTGDQEVLPKTTLLIPIRTSQPKHWVNGNRRKYRKVVSPIKGVIIGSVMIGMLLLCCLVLALTWHTKAKRWRQGDAMGPEEEQLLEMSNFSLRKISYKHLSAATKAFGDESKLGQGGFGSVYKGVLATTGTPIAVKKINPDSKQGEREFMAEVSIISQLRHRNLIQLLGYCKHGDKFLIVYDLMPNGSLDKALFLHTGAPNVLSWDQRFNIVVGVARAVGYLHEGFKQQVIHRDIKASNIMLDDEWNAKLGDFGLARLVDHLKTAATTMVMGTYGYIAPEAVNGRFTDKTDVFAFGAVVLEVACGRRSVALSAPPSDVILVDWVWQQLSEGKLLSVVDKRLTEFDTSWMQTMLLLGLLCSHPHPAGRPSMRFVIQALSGEVSVPPVPSVKPCISFEPDCRTITIKDISESNPETVSNSSGPSAESSAFSDLSVRRSRPSSSKENSSHFVTGVPAEVT